MLNTGLQEVEYVLLSVVFGSPCPLLTLVLLNFLILASLIVANNCSCTVLLIFILTAFACFFACIRYLNFFPFEVCLYFFLLQNVTSWKSLKCDCLIIECDHVILSFHAALRFSRRIVSCSLTWSHWNIWDKLVIDCCCEKCPCTHFQQTYIDVLYTSATRL